ncbi:coiled-coil domain-containing protein mad1, partial [Coemansia nantahalensis]
MAAARQKYEARADKAAAAARDLQERLDEAVRSLRRTQSAHTDEIERYQKRLAAAERAAAELRSGNEAIQSPAQGSSSLQLTVDALRREVEEKSQDVEDLQQRLRALADKDGAAVSTPSRTRVAQLERDLHEQCTYIQAVEQQNRQLRADTQRLATRAAKYDEEREANAALGAKVERLEQQQLTHARLEAEVDALRQEREQWRRVLRGADADSAAGQPSEPVPDSPFAVARTVATQRQTIRTLEAKLDAMQDATETAAQQLQSATRDAQLLRQECARLERDADSERQRATRLDSAKQHAVREAEFLRAQLRSYDSEEAELMTGNYDRQKAERIAQLEAFIDEQRARIAAAELGAAPGAAPAADGPSTALLRGYREDAETVRRELGEARDAHRRELEDAKDAHM